MGRRLHSYSLAGEPAEDKMSKSLLLSQAVALAVSRSGSAEKDTTSHYHLFQKPDLFNGHSKVFKPTKFDESNQPVDPQPDQSKTVQYKVADILGSTIESLAPMMDAVATRDFGNSTAVGDVVIEGVTVVKGAPVPFLLFLEQQLTDLHTEVQKIPTLSLDKDWSYDQQSGLWKASTVTTNRERHVEQPVVVVESTDKHPAQWTMVKKPETTGQWEHQDLSGAMPLTEKQKLIDRIRQVKEAVVAAREQANATEVKPQSLAGPILEFCLTGKKLTGATVPAQAG